MIPAMVVWLNVGCTGFAILPDLVVYAGHCGERVDWIRLDNGRLVEPIECQAHPAAAPGASEDIAFCRFVEGSLGPPAPKIRTQPLSSTEEVYLIGLGPGKRADAEPLVAAGVAHFERTGTIHVLAPASHFCSGDSGSPLFAGNGTVIGVGSGSTTYCNWVQTGLRELVFAPLSKTNIEWIEQESGLRLDAVAPQY